MYVCMRENKTKEGGMRKKFNTELEIEDGENTRKIFFKKKEKRDRVQKDSGSTAATLKRDREREEKKR